MISWDPLCFMSKRRAKYNRKVSNPNGYFIKRLVFMSHFFTFSLSLISPPHSALIFLTFSYPFSWKIAETFRENISRIPTVVNDQDRVSPDVVPQQQFSCEGVLDASADLEVKGVVLFGDAGVGEDAIDGK